MHSYIYWAELIVWKFTGDKNACDQFSPLVHSEFEGRMMFFSSDMKNKKKHPFTPHCFSEKLGSNRWSRSRCNSWAMKQPNQSDIFNLRHFVKHTELTLGWFLGDFRPLEELVSQDFNPWFKENIHSGT